MFEKKNNRSTFDLQFDVVMVQNSFLPNLVSSN